MGLKADVKCLVNNSRSPGLTPTKIPDEPYVCFKFPPPSIPTLSEASTQTNASFLTTLTSMSRPITSKKPANVQWTLLYKNSSTEVPRIKGVFQPLSKAFQNQHNNHKKFSDKSGTKKNNRSWNKKFIKKQRVILYSSFSVITHLSIIPRNTFLPRILTTHAHRCAASCTGSYHVWFPWY